MKLDRPENSLIFGWDAMDGLSPYEILTKYWGYSTFRMRQESIILSILEGKDTLALLPTGGGKSLCYQVPALCREGICLVFSPLISLMNDQVSQLKAKNIPAALIHSGLSWKDAERILENCLYGDIKLLYLSPERLFSEKAWARLIRMKVNLIAVDEAHCISQWGYDFRPSYLEIGRIREAMPRVPVLALTATATPEVARDIQEKLTFRKENIIRSSFSRSNLAYMVLKEDEKWTRLATILRKLPGCSIIYVRNRKSAKMVSEFLRQQQISSTYYHAGLSQDERVDRENKWKRNEVRVICATNAFGMGIDKPDVRIVIHLDVPESMEAYFQEAGRAGRDGLKAHAVLFYGSGDRKSMEERLEQNFPDLDYIQQMYKALAVHYQIATGSLSDESFPFDLVTFCELKKLPILPTIEALKVLEHSGLIVLNDGVYQPSLVEMIADKETLYRYQVKHAEEDSLIKAILRSYEGVFHHPVRISEYRLGKLLDLHEDDVAYFLRSLHQAGILRYQPKSDHSRIFFKGERQKSNEVKIDQKWYLFRKTRSNAQLAGIWSYIESEECRSVIMQRYFGETTSEKCKICDNCLRESGIEENQYQKYKDYVMALLKKKQSIPLQELVDSVSVFRKDKMLQIIRMMESENLVSLDPQMVIRAGDALLAS